MTNHGVCIHYMGNGCQDQQEQAGQSPERGSASHTWSHENHPIALHGKNSQCGATWEEKKTQNPHSGRKTEKAAFPPSTHKPSTAHQKIASNAKGWTTSTKNCPGHTKTLWMCQWSCWQILPGSPTERQTYKCFWVSQASPQRNGSLESSETSSLPWSLTDSLTLPGLMSTLTGLLRRGWKMVAAVSTSDTQMVTPLPSQFLVAFSAPTIELRYWLLVQLQSTCWRVRKK